MFCFSLSLDASSVRVFVDCTPFLDNFDPMSAWSSTSTKNFFADNWIKI